MNTFKDLIEEIRSRHGAEIEAARAAGLAAPEPEFDPTAWRVEQCESVLDRAVPDLFRGCLVERSEIDAWVAKFLADPKAVPSMVLMGLIGTGKTGNAYAAVMACALGYARTGRTLQWAATTHADFNAAILPKPDNEHMLTIERHMNADLFMLDDLAAARITEWAGEALMRVVDHRLTHRLPMILTTNLTTNANGKPSEFDKAVGPRMASRLRGTYRVGFWGNDRRGGVA